MFNETVNASVPNLPIHIGYGISRNICKFSDNHYHDEIEFLSVKQGKMSCTVGGKDYIITTGEIAFINSRVPHATAGLEIGTTSILVQINIDAFLNDDISKYLSHFINNGENDILILKSENNFKLVEYIDNIKDEFNNANVAYDLFIKANIYNILAYLYRNKILIDANSFFDFKSIDKIKPILQYINEHYQESITLDKISSVLNLNEFYFCRVFKKATNSTFTKYLNYVRICKAEKLLSSTSKNIVEIALETGFSSVPYFNSTFKKLKNCTPTDYRKIKYAQK